MFVLIVLVLVILIVIDFGKTATSTRTWLKMRRCSPPSVGLDDGSSSASISRMDGSCGRCCYLFVDYDYEHRCAEHEHEDECATICSTDKTASLEATFPNL